MSRRETAEKLVEALNVRYRQFYGHRSSIHLEGDGENTGSRLEKAIGDLLDFCEGAPPVLTSERVSALESGAMFLRAFSQTPDGGIIPSDTPDIDLSVIADVLDGIVAGPVVFDHEAPKPVFSAAEVDALGEAAIVLRLRIVHEARASVLEMGESKVARFHEDWANVLDGIRKRCESDREPGPTFAAVAADRDRLTEEVIDLKSRGIVLLRERDELKSEAAEANSNARLQRAAVDRQQGRVRDLREENESLKADHKTLGANYRDVMACASQRDRDSAAAIKALKSKLAEPRSSVPADLDKLLDAVGNRAVEWHLAGDYRRRGDVRGTEEAVEAAEGASDMAREAVKAAFAKPAEPCADDPVLACDFYNVIKRIAEIADRYDTKPVGDCTITPGLSTAGAKALAEETNSARSTLLAIVGRIRGEP